MTTCKTCGKRKYERGQTFRVGDDCECGTMSHTDERIEEIIEEAKSLSIQLEAEGGWNIPYEGIYEDKMIDWLRTAFTTYGQSRYEAGVKAERERCELRLRKEAKAHTHSKVAHGIAMYEKGKNNK